MPLVPPLGSDMLWRLGPDGKSTLYHPLVGEGGETTAYLWLPHWGAISSLAATLGGLIRTAMAQPAAEVAVNLEPMALLQGASKNVAGYCAAAKNAAASLPNKK